MPEWFDYTIYDEFTNWLAIPRKKRPRHSSLLHQPIVRLTRTLLGGYANDLFNLSSASKPR